VTSLRTPGPVASGTGSTTPTSLSGRARVPFGPASTTRSSSVPGEGDGDGDGEREPSGISSGCPFLEVAAAVRAGPPRDAPSAVPVGPADRGSSVGAGTCATGGVSRRRIGGSPLPAGTAVRATVPSPGWKPATVERAAPGASPAEGNRRSRNGSGGASSAEDDAAEGCGTEEDSGEEDSGEEDSAEEDSAEEDSAEEDSAEEDGVTDGRDAAWTLVGGVAPLDGLAPVGAAAARGAARDSATGSDAGRHS
jgi:hypothetical protein